MLPARKIIHIVADFVTAGGGREHARALRTLLSTHANVQCWSEEYLPPTLAKEARVIRPFSAEYPSGGTLIVLGPQRRLTPWISRCRAKRIVLVCNASEPTHLFRQLACIRGNGLPEPEISYVSHRLRETIGLAGRVNISPLMVENFKTACRPQRRPIVGRHSRDTPEKHHPMDASLYKQLVLNGFDVRIMGGTSLSSVIPSGTAGIELLDFGYEHPVQFLMGLDIYFYRTHPALHETAGRSLLEAMASGLAIVASTAGGYCDWLRHGESGYLINDQDEAFNRIMELGTDAELRKKLGAAAQAAAFQLSGPEARQRLIDWYLADTNPPINA